MRVTCWERGAEVWRLRMTASEEATSTLIDAQGVGDLRAILDQAESSGCRVLVLEGEAGAFCQGLDLAQATGEGAVDVGEVHRFADCLERLRTSSSAVVAAVDGEAAGGGVGLAAAADIVFATQDSTFALPELALGLLPAVVLPVLLERMPPQKARQLCLFGTVGAARALELGLVDRLTKADGLEQAIRAAIKQVLRCSPAAVAGLKDLVRQIERLELGEALRAGADRTAALLGAEEVTTTIRAFLEGEPLPWFSRYRPGRS